MNARVIIQMHPDGKLKNLCFTQDMQAPTEDFLVNWPGSLVIDDRVMIIAMSEATENALLDLELRSVGNVTDIAPELRSVNADALERTLERLQR